MNCRGASNFRSKDGRKARRLGRQAHHCIDWRNPFEDRRSHTREEPPNQGSRSKPEPNQRSTTREDESVSSLSFFHPSLPHPTTTQPTPYHTHSSRQLIRHILNHNCRPKLQSLSDPIQRNSIRLWNRVLRCRSQHAQHSSCVSGKDSLIRSSSRMVGLESSSIRRVVESSEEGQRGLLLLSLLLMMMKVSSNSDDDVRYSRMVLLLDLLLLLLISSVPPTAVLKGRPKRSSAD